VRASRERRRGTGAASPGTSGMVDAGTYYWHFVDAVWVVVFIVVYLL
jgi:heme/copper-type cytochrome/quinol oxidase subunit 3